ncbi:GerAB/ArcD/ProY family transporter [Lentibacillus halophilus]|uniref:GerAB/ArcD/ProY family transporter n=1 Tax=Lentibacillus halophilus TaxID=295065 RepID=A0ABN0ZAL9_9BACI
MIKLKDKVSAFFVFFLITSSQVGVGVLGFQRVIGQYAGHDAWIAVIIAGIAISVIIWIMYRLLSHHDIGDIVAIHRFTYGKWLGAIFTLLFTAYLMLMTAVVLRTYVEVIQVWMFPHIKIWALLLLILPLVYYTISSEFRTVVGVCFLGVVYPSLLLLTLFYPLKYATLTNIMPVMDHSVTELMQSSSLAVLEFIGFSALLVFYPYIRDAVKSQTYAHLGNGYSLLIYLMVSLVTYLYYNQTELREVIWPTLGLWKIIELPFFARFEYLGIATLFFAILPNLVLLVWASARTLDRTFNAGHKRMAILLLVILFVANIVLTDRMTIGVLNNVLGNIGLGFLFGYVPFLFVLNWIRRKGQKNGP